MVAAQIRPGSVFEVTDRTVLFTIRPKVLFRQSEQYALYDVASDDQRFVMIRLRGAREAGQLIVVENFFEELKARVGN